MGRKRNKKGAKEDVDNVVKAEVAMAKAVRRVQEILRDHSEQEIRATLLQCNMNHNVAIHRLLSHQETSNEVGATTQLPDSSITLVPNQSAITNGVTRSVPISSSETAPSLHVPSSSDVTNGETRTVPISSSEAVPPLSVPSSSAITNGETRSVPTSSNLPLSLPSSSATINGETRSVPISSNVAVPPLSVSSSRAPTNAKPKRQDTGIISTYGPPMAEVLRGLQVPSKQNLTKAPVMADSPLLHQKPDATNPIFNSFTESDAARDPQHSAFLMDTRQSIATASLLGPRPPEAFGTYPRSEPHINQQAMNQGQFPSGQYGNMMNSPYLRRPAQNMPRFKRGGGINSNTLAHHVNLLNSTCSLQEQNDASLYQSLDSPFTQYRNSNLPLSATSTVPSYHGSAYDFGMSSGNAANSRLGYEDVSRYHLPSNSRGTSTGPSSHRSAFGFDMPSGNAANSRLRFEDVSRNYWPSNSSSASTGPSYNGSSYGGGMSSGNAANSRLGYEDVSRNHFPSVPHQGMSPFVGRVEGEDSYRSLPPHRLQEWEAYFERNRAYFATLDQYK